jgi:hypothetical protein
MTLIEAPGLNNRKSSEANILLAESHPESQKINPEYLSYQVMMTDSSPALAVNDARFDAEKACAFLERGGIIFFPKSPFAPSPEDQSFLLTQKQLEAGYHKNICYRPLEDRVTGVKANSGTDVERLRKVLRAYSQSVTEFLHTFLAPYTRNWQYDFASFRPLEEKGRKLRLRARNDLLHVDSFPTRPVFGNRIFRVFTNINPELERVWRTSDTFETLAHGFKNQVNPPSETNSPSLRDLPGIKQLGDLLGFKSNASSAYDKWMLNFHNFLKENSQFQATARKDIWRFPPGSSWMVFTDMVSHSVLSGQHALEQSYIVSKDDQVVPELAPVNILKRVYK